MQLYCPICGNIVNDTDQFCPHCGTTFSTSQNNDYQEPNNQQIQYTNYDNQSNVYYQQNYQQQYTTVNDTTGKSKKKKIIAICSGVLAFVILLTVIFSSGSDSRNEATYNPTVNNNDYEFVTDNNSDNQSSTTSNTLPTTQNDISRTIMIYIVASDLEANYAAATTDLQEMLDAGVNDEKNNIVVYAGGTTNWQNQLLTKNNTSTLLVKQDDIIEVNKESVKNMGEAETLTSFLKYCKDKYPADEYSLILWNHGGGPNAGYGLDMLSGDSLQLTELVSALKKSPFNSNQKLEFLGFDACLMGTIETAWIFKDYAEYFVASQETEPGQGWNYEFLSMLNYCENGKDLGQVIIDTYFDYYESVYAQYPRYESEITLSCADLSKIDDVKKGIDSLFSSANSKINSGEIANLSRCRYKSKAFGKAASSDEYDLVDLKHLTTLLKDEYSSQASALLSALDSYITYSRSNTKNANGVSIYHPYDDLTLAKRFITELKKINFSNNYLDYISNFSNSITTNATKTTNYHNFFKATGTAKANGEKSELSMKLNEEQLKTFSSAQYYIFRQLDPSQTFSKQTEYLHIFSGQDATLSADGTLNATYNNKAVFGKNKKTGQYSDYPLSMIQIYDSTLDEKFYFPCMFWHFGEDLEMDLEPVNWLMKIKNGKPQLLNAYSIDAEKTDLFPDKYLIDSENFEVYSFANNSYTTKTNDSGNVELVFSGSSYGFEYQKEEGFEIELKPIEEKEKNKYYAVFIIEDIYGNSYTSSFFSLDSK